MGEGVEAIKNNSHMCCGRHTMDASANGDPPQRFPHPAAGINVTMAFTSSYDLSLQFFSVFLGKPNVEITW
jgi:hypothetical protein